MPKNKTIERAREDKREGKAPSTQAGEFVREEIELIRKGAHKLACLRRGCFALAFVLAGAFDGFVFRHTFVSVS